MRNYFVAAGLNSVGITSSFGVGHVLSKWIVNGHPPYDLHQFDIARYVKCFSFVLYYKGLSVFPSFFFCVFGRLQDSEFNHVVINNSFHHRAGAHDMSKQFLHDRAVEIIGRKYKLLYPKMEYNTGRNVK